MTIFLRLTRPSRSNPSDATLAFNSFSVSSKAINTPGSSNCAAPRTRNSAASSVLPQPAPPQTSVGRPRGSPPPVISSSPRMPVGHLGRVFAEDASLEPFFVIHQHPRGKQPIATRTECNLPGGMAHSYGVKPYLLTTDLLTYAVKKEAPT